MNLYKSFFKRFLDLTITLVGFIFLFPVFLIITLLLFWINKGKPFFFQARPGKDGEIFKIIKFRSMTDERDENGNLLPEAIRLTKIGAFIRKYSLDEIPQLLNIIKGDMSLIGPRPLLVSYLPRYNDIQKHRHDIRPGITGWAQVNGRNALSWEEKFNYDVWYVNNLSLPLDVKIFFLTFVKVISKKGIYTSETLVMEEFMGSESS